MLKEGKAMNEGRYQLLDELYSECLEKAILQEEHRGENYIDFRIEAVMEMTNWLEEQEEIKERINIQRNRNEYRSSDFWSLEHKAIDAEHTARSMLEWIQELDGYEIYIERQEFIDKELKREGKYKEI